jgi:hypothetical protein
MTRQEAPACRRVFGSRQIARKAHPRACERVALASDFEQKRGARITGEMGGMARELRQQQYRSTVDCSRDRHQRSKGRAVHRQRRERPFARFADEAFCRPRCVKIVRCAHRSVLNYNNLSRTLRERSFRALGALSIYV